MPIRRSEAAVRSRLPARLARLVTRVAMAVLVAGFDRLSFGTDGSRQMYEAYVSPQRLAAKSAVFEALPGPCDCLPDEPEPKAAEVIFVGSFVERKGIRQLLAAWDPFEASHPGVGFRLIGKGPLLEDVERWAGERPSVVLEVDPPRDRIHEALRGAAVLVLLSQRHGHWREQIGLPILEALSHDCVVVATTESGLASWLAANGHQVVAPDATADTVATAMADALDTSTGGGGSLDELPATDQRLVADEWMVSRSQAG